MNIICIALSTGLAFFLFYFTTPFVAGAEMLDMYQSGWWKFLYYQFSGFGTLLYRLFERIFGVASNYLLLKASKIPLGVKKTLVIICNLFYYIGILYGLLKLNDVVLETIVGSADFELAYGDSLQAWDVFGNIGVLFGMLFSPEGIAADGGFGGHLLRSVGAIVAYIFYSLFFFSVVFGLLENKVEQPFKPLFDDGAAQPGHGSFVEAVGEFIKSSVGNIAVMRHFFSHGVKLIFGLIILLYAVVQDRLGVQCTLGQVIGNTLEQSGFMDMVSSFVFSALWTWLLLLLARLIVRFLPDSIQGWIANTGTELGERVKAQQQRRHDWALQHDVMTRDFSDRGGFGGLNELHLRD